MTDKEIEQARKSLEPPPHEPLYVDAKGADRSDLFVNELERMKILDSITAEIAREAEYVGTGTLLAPFLTVDEARKVQKPGQSIVIAGYATIGAAPVPAKIPENIKKRCE